MKTKLLVVFGVVIMIAAIFAASVIGINNSFVRQEKGIEAQYTQNQNNYDSYWKKLQEVAQVPDMYTDDMRKVYNATMSGRYGPGGSSAVMQWIKEQNPQVDASIYRQVQQVIESGRNSFESDQRALIDKKRVYETSLETFPNSLVAEVFGFPRIDLAKFGIVTSGQTQEAFASGQSEALMLRSAEPES